MGFFNKPEVRQPAPTPAPRKSKPVPSASPTPATFIGPAAQINGELVSSDNLHIEGKIEGKVKSSKQIVIGEKGQVQAEVEAELVSIRGKLEGNCVASNKVEITSSGKVYGNISAPRIVVAEGAVFRGASNMTIEQKPKTYAGSKDQKPQPPQLNKPEGAQEKTSPSFTPSGTLPKP